MSLKPFKEDKISTHSTQVIELRKRKGASQEGQGVTATFLTAVMQEITN